MKHRISYIIIIGLVCVTMFTVIVRLKEEHSSSPPLLTMDDIQIIESYLKIDFPESIKIIKAYHGGWDSETLYVYFEFDKKDIEQFMKNRLWGKVQNSEDVESLLPVIKRKYSFFFPKSEELEWWRPNKKNIAWVSRTLDSRKEVAKGVYERLTIILEEADTMYSVYIDADWICLDGSVPYMENLRRLFPFKPDWSERESGFYPFLKQKISP